MAHLSQVWKVIFFPSDKTFSIVKENEKSGKVQFLSDENVLVKFGQEWFQGQVLGTGGTKKEATQLMEKLESSFLSQNPGHNDKAGKKI